MKRLVLLMGLCVAFVAMYGQKIVVTPDNTTGQRMPFYIQGPIQRAQVQREPYKFLTEADVASYISARGDQRLDIVRWLYLCLTYAQFDKKAIENYFNDLCSSDIRAAIAAHKRESYMDGWQIFLSPESNENVTVVYEGNDWYKVNCDSQEVRLQIVYDNKMRAVLVGMQNSAYDVDIALNPSTKVKGYRYAAFTDYYNKTLSYIESVNNEIVAYAKAKPQLTLQGFVTDNVMNAYREKVQRENELVVKQFYANMGAKDFSEKYEKLVLPNLQDYIKDYTKNGEAEKTWSIFLPGSPADDEVFDVKYVGHNWYEVSLAASPEHKVRVMPALLTDKDHTPVIVGLHNAEYNINKNIYNLAVSTRR